MLGSATRFARFLENVSHQRSARRRRSFRQAFDLGILASNRLFPQKNLLESIIHLTCSAARLDLPVPSRTSHTNAPLGVVARSAKRLIWEFTRIAGPCHVRGTVA